MHGALSRTLYSVNVAETRCDRNYWATREWVNGPTSGVIRSSSIIIAPWENFREGEPAIFPQGTKGVIDYLRRSLESYSIAVAIDREKYKEIALHGREWRLPTLLVPAVIIPVFTQILTNRIEGWLFSPSEKDTIEAELIVEGERGHCISVRYKGPPSRFIETIASEAHRCFPSPPTDEFSGPSHDRAK